MPGPQAELFEYAQTECGISIPRAPAAHIEQRVLPVPGTIEERWERWQHSVDGQRVIAEVTRMALEEVVQGATRISVNALFEKARATLRLEADNTMRAPLARLLRERYPALRDLIEIRERRAT